MAVFWRVILVLAIASTCSSQDNDDDDYLYPLDDDFDSPEDEDYDPPPEDDDLREDQDYSQTGEATENCICVPLYLCAEGEIVTDGSNIIDARKKAHTGKKSMDGEYVPPECGPYHVCCRNPESPTDPPYISKCGTRNPGGLNSRVMTSLSGEAQFAEWPWQAAILKRDGEDYVFKCGGTLIDNRHIITIAHCAEKFTNDKASMIVRLGEWDTQTSDESLPHEDIEVEKIILHPQYRRNNLHNDIAVVKLSRDVVFKPNIDTICLPQDDDDFTGQQCTVTGWGTDAYKSGVFSAVMKQVTVPIVANKECQRQLRRTRLGNQFVLYEGFMCAGGKEGEDTCKGDGGGPLVCYKPDKSYTVIGLVSWGIDCGVKGIPGVYVNVKKYTDWIASKTGKRVEDYWRDEVV